MEVIRGSLGSWSGYGHGDGSGSGSGDGYGYGAFSFPEKLSRLLLKFGACGDARTWAKGRKIDRDTWEAIPVMNWRRWIADKLGAYDAEALGNGEVARWPAIAEALGVEP